MMFVRVASVFVAVVLLAACSAPTATPNSFATKLTVVATTTQLEDVVRNVAGDRVTVVGLVPRNGDPHAFEPTPADVRKIAGAAAVFKNGANLEGWLDKLIENAGGQRPIFDMAQGVQLATIAGSFQDAGEIDPHIWMNPQNMVTVTDEIAAGLKQIDPGGAAVYDANSTAYKQKLRDLDAWAAQQIATIPPERRKLVTAHDALGYFAGHYGLEVLGFVIPGVSTETGETSAQQLGALEQKIKQAQVPTIFGEASNNPKFIDQVARDTGVKVDTLYVDSLGDAGGEAGTYLDFIRADVNKIVRGLK